MIPGEFSYVAPQTIPDALALLQQHGDEAKILAGGQSLIPMMRFRLAEPAYLVDINHIPGLTGVEERNGSLVIGALTREHELEDLPLIRQRFPILRDTADVIADPLVRNLATIGGNIAHADPANDHPATLLALDARVTVVGPSGERVIPIDDFFVGPFETSMQPDEILTAITIPFAPPRSGGAYVKFERKVGDYAIAATAAQVTLAEDGSVQAARIGLTNLSITPMRARAAEAALIGKQPGDEVIRDAAKAAGEECDPPDDALRGPAGYKRAVARTMTARALRLAVERARSDA